MIGALLFLLQQGPDAHYKGGATSKIAGTTALAGKFFRFLMSSVPQWVQIGGILIGVPVAIILAWQAWKHRHQLWAWWVARPRSFQFAIVGAVSVVGLSGVGAGLFGYNYMMHDNDFCQSCHIMDIPWNRFQTTAHKNLQCHACHRQPLYVSSVELFWWVTRRQMEVPPHDKVPSAVCGECHMRQGTDSARTLVTLTAGHVVHLKSDSSALKDVQCVTCHGRDFHVFIPNNSTCAQSGCHVNQKVNLGAMSSQSFKHCTMCHDFKSKVVPGTTVAQARAALGPKVLECTKCHAMSDKMRSFDLAADPHKGNCAMCHDAHKQTEPKDAFKTCATAQCHASADTLTAFHRGLGGHSLDQCGACHRAHSWKVKGTDCLACHKTINQDRPAAKRVSVLFKPATYRRSAARRRPARPVVRFASFARTSRVVPPSVPQAPAVSDSTFPHSRHKSITCTDCHGTTNTHGGLKFSRPEGCIACHHSGNVRVQCSACHSAASLDARAAQAVRATPSTSTFVHSRHSSVACAECHRSTGANGSLKFARVGGCIGCHHSANQRAQCSACHNVASLDARAAPGPASTSTFLHARHTSVACADCHGTTANHVGMAFDKLGGCIGCHHSATQRAQCSTCHAAASLGQHTVAVTFTITPRRESVTRPIAFAHARHNAIECARCHGSDVNRSVAPTTCTTCHVDHHGGAADCASCHPTARTGHDRSAHEGCAGCHTDTRVAVLTASRAVCVACHQEQRNHYPARDCGACHALDANAMLRAGRPPSGR